MFKTWTRKTIALYIVISLIIAFLLFTVTRNTILPGLATWQAFIFWLAIATLPVAFLGSEWLLLSQILKQIFDHNTKTRMSFEERNTNILALLEKRNAKMLALFEERNAKFNKNNADQKDFVERRLRNLLEVQVATLSSNPIQDSNVSPAAENLLKYIQARRQKYAQDIDFALLREKSQIREVYLSELFAGIEQVWLPIGAINEETGHANHVDLLYVSAIARHLQCQNLFEFGTYIGRTTYHLTFAAEGAVVTTLNLPPEVDARVAPFLGSYFRGTDREPFIRQIFADSREFDTTPYRQKMDFIFIDGDHGYELVKNDTAKAFEMLAPNGVIVWHDYAAKSPGLVQFFQEFTQNQPVFWIKNTCLLVHLAGANPLTFTPHSMRPSLETQLRNKHRGDYTLYHL